MIAVMALLIPALWGAGILVGAIFLVIGLRGRSVGDAPHCRRCRFDLTGSAGATRCPECGAALDSRGAIRIGQSRRDWRTALAGAFLFACGAGGLAALASGSSWTRLAPTGWLVHVEYRWSGATRRDEISEEVRGRVGRGAITSSATMPIVRTVVADQARLARQVEEGRGVGAFDAHGVLLVQDAAAAGLLTPQEFDVFILDSVDADLVFDPPLKAGEIRPRLAVSGTRCGPLPGGPPPPFGTPSIDMEIMSIEIAGSEIYGRGASSSFTASPRSGAKLGPTALSTNLPGGEHRVRLRAILRRGSSERAVTREAMANVLAEDRVLPRAEIESILRRALSHPTLEVLADPANGGRLVRVGLECVRGHVEPTDQTRLALIDGQGREHVLRSSQASWRGREEGAASLTWTFAVPEIAFIPGARARLRIEAVRVAPDPATPQFEGFGGWVPLEESPIEIELPPLPESGEGDSAQP